MVSTLPTHWYALVMVFALRQTIAAATLVSHLAHVNTQFVIVEMRPIQVFATREVFVHLQKTVPVRITTLEMIVNTTLVLPFEWIMPVSALVMDFVTTLTIVRVPLVGLDSIADFPHVSEWMQQCHQFAQEPAFARLPMFVFAMATILVWLVTPILVMD